MPVLVPTSTIVAGPQAGGDRFDLIPWRDQQAMGPGSRLLFLNGSDEYVILYENSNFPASSNTSVFKLAVYKNGVQQDTANKPTIRNHRAPGIVQTQAYCGAFDVVQIGTLLYIFYCIDGTSETDSVLAFITFDMSSDSFGSPNVSTLAPVLISVADPENQFASPTPNFYTVYDSNANRITIVAANAGVDGWCRPAFATYLVGTDTWDTLWTTLGDDASVEMHQGSFSGCVDCRGAVNIVIVTRDFSDPIILWLNHLSIQTIYPDGTVSAIQSIGVTVNQNSSSIAEPDSWILCTGAELIILYGSADNSLGFWTQLNCARATVPVTNTLPVSWASQVVRAASSLRYFAWVPFFISNELYAVESLYDNFLSDGTLTGSHYNGSTWDNDITFSPAITLALANGDTIGTNALITYDLAAPVTTGGSPIASSQRLNSIRETRSPVCEVASISIACPISPLTATVGVPYVSDAPIVTGGTPSYTFALLSGPGWMGIDASTGVVSGTPDASGAVTYEIEVTDSSSPPLSATVPAPCPLTVGPAAPGTLPCENITPQPSTDVQFKLIKVLATMGPVKRLPVRGSVQ